MFIHTGCCCKFRGFTQHSELLSGWTWRSHAFHLLTQLLKLALLIITLAAPMPTWAATSVTVLQVEGAIGPATSDYILRGLDHAAKDHAELVVLQMDTPGGLDTSMRDIIKAIIASPVPVASYVAPSGARAASAGTYILYASHIAAMAPGTNLGAATPVQIGAPGSGKTKKPFTQKPDKETEESNQDRLSLKQISDASAYIRSLAQMRGRNADWAEQAVREAVSLSASEALKIQVIDYIAKDPQDLLQQLDGRQIKLAAGERVLTTKSAKMVEFAPDWRVRLLAVITNPNMALLLMMLGIYGLFFEFSSPGLGAPGIIGAICLLLGLYALQLLPVNYAGAALIILGIGCMVAEAYLATFGVLGIGGIAAFVAGAIILIDTDLPAFGVSPPLIMLIAASSALIIAGIGGMALRSRRRPVVSGAQQLVGSLGEIVEAIDNEGWARIHGELWRVRASKPLRLAQQVQVTAQAGLVLQVIPIEE